MKIICLFLVVLAGVIAIAPDDAHAYDALTTHQALTQEIVRLYNLIHPDRPIDAISLQNILRGSVEEDAPPRWINHFYNPLTQEGWTGDKMGAFPSSIVQLFSFIGVSSEGALSAVEWMKNNIIQDKYSSYGGNHTWKTGLKEYAAGNTALANQTLGHTLHLLEDMGVPDHTRDDTHAQELSAVTGDLGSPYEDYATRFTPQTFSLADALYKKGAPIVSKSTPEEYLVSMATYSNKYFFSKDTINSPSFPSPHILESDCDANGYCYSKDENGVKMPIAFLNKRLDQDGNYIDKIELQNKPTQYPILESYFSHLSRQILLHGVGMIELFYKQGEEEKENQQYPQHLVTYDFSFITPPIFSLVGVGQTIVATAQNLWGSVASAAQGTLAWAQGLWSRFSGSNTPESLAFIPTNQPSTTSTPSGAHGNQTASPAGATHTTTTIEQTPPAPAPAPKQPLPQNTVYVKRVIDGDTIVLTDGTVVRYIGIDAPEIAYQENAGDCYADQARDKNKALVEGKPLRLEYTDQKLDKYDRTLAYVWADNVLVNRELVAGGYAYAYNFGHPHPRETEFLTAQTEARNATRGLWGSACKNTDDTTTATTTAGAKATTTADTTAQTIVPTRCAFASSTAYRPDGGIVFNEIAWMGSTYGATKEWIELKNRGSAPLSTRGWSVIAQDDGITAPLPAITVAPGQIILLERTDDTPVPEKKADAFFTGAIKNSDTRIALVDESCRIVDAVSAQPSWPAGDATSRRTMERDWNGGWYTSAAPNGTPGKENEWGYGGSGAGGGSTGGSAGTATPTTSTTTTTASSTQPVWAPVIINEIYYDAPGSDDGQEWIELYNAGTSSVTLSGWKIEESGTAHALTAHGATTIDPGGYAIVARDYEQFLPHNPGVTAPVWTSAFSLNNDGETIALKNDTLLINSATYASSTGANGNGKSLQKFDTAWKEATPTPGAQNKEDAPTQTSTPTATHALISEMQVAGQSADDEFIELYNPTQTTLSLAGYSLQYISGKATTTAHAYKELFRETDAIAPHGFFLLARSGGAFEMRADMPYNAFSLSGATTGGIVVLSRATGTIAALNDPEIIDAVAYGAPALAPTAAPLPDIGQSIERKAWESGACYPATDAYEFSGNGCAGNDVALNFDIRQTPQPQNRANLPEPRTAPATPEHFSASFETSSLTLQLTWDAITHTTYRLTDETDTTTPRALATTTQSSWRTQLHAVGYEATFSLVACDAESLCSNPATTTIAIPSPLTSFAIYRDPRTDNRYAVDMTYDAYPFVPDLYTSPPNNRWKMMALYLNQDAPTTPENTDHNFAGLSNTLPIAYPRCAGGMTPGAALLMPDTPSNCSVNGGIYNVSMGFGTQQETHLDVALAQTPNDLTLSPNDFVTIAFYSFYDFMPSDGTVGYFRLVAVDKTRHYFSNQPPPHHAPTLEGSLSFTFNQTTSGLTTSWSPATDTDTAQSTIRYEIRYHTDGPWIDTGNATSHTTTTAPGDMLDIAVRAIDDFGNRSQEISGSWSYPTTTASILQNITDGWSNGFGTKWSAPWSAPGPAVFQRVQPHSTLSFNTIFLRIRQMAPWQNNPFIYPATLKLGIYADASGAVDWNTKIGEAVSGKLYQPDPTSDISFVFPSSITLQPETTYWLALEVAAYDAYYPDYAWQYGGWYVATASTNPYPDGGMAYGWGNPLCADPSSCAPGTVQTNSAADWYMIFATRE